eukprot:608904-Hanusia_phi.AAC.5
MGRQDPSLLPWGRNRNGGGGCPYFIQHVRRHGGGGAAVNPTLRSFGEGPPLAMITIALIYPPLPRILNYPPLL